jgi:hypothetical protein
MDTAAAVLGLFKDTLGPILNIFLIWLLLAIATGTIYEWVSSLYAWEASMLQDAITQMLGDPDITRKIYDHPLIQGLYTNNGKRKPSSIPEDKFALVLFQQVLNSGAIITDSENEFNKLKKNIAALKMSETNNLKNFAVIVDTLLIGIEEKADDVTHAFSQAIQRVEGWFNDSMEQLRGSYQRRVQLVAIVVGISISVIFNIDTVGITNYYWRQPIFSKVIDAQISQFQVSENLETSQSLNPEQTAQALQQLSALSLPFGWSKTNLPKDVSEWTAKLVGLLLSGIAAALGAPFWLDVIRRPFKRRTSVESEKS